MKDPTLKFILRKILRWRMLSFVMFLFIIVYPLFIWGKLPARLAIQFSSSGVPLNYVNKGFAYGLFAYLSIILLGTNLFFDVRSIKILFRDTTNESKWYAYLPISDVFYSFLAYIVYNTLQFNINQVNSFAIWKFLLFLGLPVGVISLLNNRCGKVQEKPYDSEKRIVKNWGKCLYHDRQDNRYMRIFALFICIVGLFLLFLVFFSHEKMNLILTAFGHFVVSFLLFILARMGFLIYEHAIVIKIGMPKLYKKVIPIDTIEEVHPESFSPLNDFGGWGVRLRGDGTHGYFIRGNRGLFILTETSKWLLGFNNPEEAEQIVKKQLGITVK